MNATETLETETEVTPRKRKRFELPTPPIPTGRKPVEIKFRVSKNNIRSFTRESGDKRRNPVRLYHLYVPLTEWIGRQIPDSGVNPRSHGIDCVKSHLAQEIEETLNDSPEDFYLANRGATILADDLKYDDKSGMVTITLTDPEKHGIADGATTDAIIAKAQGQLEKPLKEMTAEELPEKLKSAEIHLEVFLGLTDRDKIATLVKGRNRSLQVRSWSLSDFSGRFDFIKDILEAEGSQFKGKIGYDENAPQSTSVLDVLSLLTLFHPEFDEEKETETNAPTIAYASKGKLDSRLLDEKMLKGYRGLAPILPDILRLHDYIYANFAKRYDEAYGPNARLGRRPGIDSRRQGEPYKLPLTDTESDYKIARGFIYPLLASFRALVSYKGRGGEAKWKTDPYKFFDEHGRKLVSDLIKQSEYVAGNPNRVGKTPLAYEALHQRVKVLLAKE